MGYVTFSGVPKSCSEWSQPTYGLAGPGIILRETTFGTERIGHRKSNKNCVPTLRGLQQDAGPDDGSLQVRKFVRKIGRSQFENSKKSRRCRLDFEVSSRVHGKLEWCGPKQTGSRWTCENFEHSANRRVKPRTGAVTFGLSWQGNSLQLVHIADLNIRLVRYSDDRHCCYPSTRTWLIGNWVILPFILMFINH